MLTEGVGLRGARGRELEVSVHFAFSSAKLSATSSAPPQTQPHLFSPLEHWHTTAIMIAGAHSHQRQLLTGKRA